MCLTFVSILLAAPFFGDESNNPTKPETNKIYVSADESQQTCPICNEKFTSEWNTEEEEWVYTNCIKASDDQIYHKDCYKEDAEDSFLGKRTHIIDGFDDPDNVKRTKL